MTVVQGPKGRPLSVRLMAMPVLAIAIEHGQNFLHGWVCLPELRGVVSATYDVLASEEGIRNEMADSMDFIAPAIWSAFRVLGILSQEKFVMGNTGIMSDFRQPGIISRLFDAINLFPTEPAIRRSGLSVIATLAEDVETATMLFFANTVVQLFEMVAASHRPGGAPATESRWMIQAAGRILGRIYCVGGDVTVLAVRQTASWLRMKVAYSGIVLQVVLCGTQEALSAGFSPHDLRSAGLNDVLEAFGNSGSSKSRQDCQKAIQILMHK